MKKAVERFQLVGDKVILRPVELTDYADIYSNIQDKKIALYVGTPYPYSETNAKEFTERAIQKWDENEEKQFVIIDKTSGKLAGTIGLMYKSSTGPVAEIGYWIGDKFRGGGLVTEASKLLIKYAFEKEGMSRVYGRAYSQNRSSCRVFEKLGFTLEGRLRKHQHRFGVIFDVNSYGLLKEEFKA